MAENVDVEFPAFKIYFKVTRQNINLNLELSLAQLSLRLSHGKIMFKYLLGMKLRSFPRLQCEYLVLQNIWLANVGLVTKFVLCLKNLALLLHILLEISHLKSLG